MGVQPRSAPLPPHRHFWVERMAPGPRRSHLVAEHLEGMMERRNRGESASIRAFLAAWRRATQGGNLLGFELRVQRAEVNMAVVFAYCPASGPVRWLPAIVVPWSDRMERIGRECGDGERFPARPEPTRDAWGQAERRRPPVLPKARVELVRL